MVEVSFYSVQNLGMIKVVCLNLPRLAFVPFFREQLSCNHANMGNPSGSLRKTAITGGENSGKLEHLL